MRIMLVTLFILAGLHFIGMQGLYYSCSFYDNFLHLAGGIWVAYTAFYFRISRKKTADPELLLALVMAAGLSWEGLEYFSDHWLSRYCNLPIMQLGYGDTVSDLIMDLLGGLIFVFIIKRKMKKNDPKEGRG